jgi:hypothetical protein
MTEIGRGVAPGRLQEWLKAQQMLVNQISKLREQEQDGVKVNGHQPGSRRLEPMAKAGPVLEPAKPSAGAEVMPCQAEPVSRPIPQAELMPCLMPS